jgi:hypothetical protein
MAQMQVEEREWQEMARRGGSKAEMEAEEKAA